MNKGRHHKRGEESQGGSKGGRIRKRFLEKATLANLKKKSCVKERKGWQGVLGGICEGGRSKKPLSKPFEWKKHS